MVSSSQIGTPQIGTPQIGTPQIGRWRATYTPGRWVVLAGPTAMVVMPPARPQHAGLINALWDDVLAAVDIGDLAERLVRFRIDQVPHLGVFFFDGTGMRSLVRGSIRVVDLATGDVVADGDGILTWSEVGLGGVAQVRIDLEPVDQDTVLQLPLVVGSVQASAVVLDATASVSSPQWSPGHTTDAASGPAAAAAGTETDSTEADPKATGPGPAGPLVAGAAAAAGAVATAIRTAMPRPAASEGGTPPAGGAASEMVPTAPGSGSGVGAGGEIGSDGAAEPSEDSEAGPEPTAVAEGGPSLPRDVRDGAAGGGSGAGVEPGAEVGSGAQVEPEPGTGVSSGAQGESGAQAASGAEPEPEPEPSTERDSAADTGSEDETATGSEPLVPPPAESVGGLESAAVADPAAPVAGRHSRDRAPEVAPQRGGPTDRGPDQPERPGPADEDELDLLDSHTEVMPDAWNARRAGEERPIGESTDPRSSGPSPSDAAGAGRPAGLPTGRGPAAPDSSGAPSLRPPSPVGAPSPAPAPGAAAPTVPGAGGIGAPPTLPPGGPQGGPPPGGTPPGYRPRPERQAGGPGPGGPGPGPGGPGNRGPGQPQPGQFQPGQSQPGQHQPGQAQPGQAQPGQAQPGQAQPGQHQPGQHQPNVAGLHPGPTPGPGPQGSAGPSVPGNQPGPQTEQGGLIRGVPQFGEAARPQRQTGPAAPESAADHDGATIFQTGLARRNKPPTQGSNQGEPLVLAVTCALQHPNPPETDRCRRCGGSVQSQNPRLVPRPVLAVLRPSSGGPLEVDRTVLVGRSPAATRVGREHLPRLLTVPSPSHDISRTHLQVAPEGWSLVVTDLHSTNGTTLVRPGEEPERERLTPGEPMAVEPGWVLDLGDGVTIAVERLP